MVVVILSNTSSSKTPYHEWIKDSHESVILLCSSNVIETFNEQNFLHLECFKDYENNIEVEEKVLEFSKKYDIKNIIALSEFDICRVAKLREILNISGQNYFSANAYRNKVLMKQILNMGNILVPKFSLANNYENIRNIINDVGFPIVLKPTMGSGSENTYILKDEKSLEEKLVFLKNELDQYEIEQFIDGEMYHVDGLYHYNEYSPIVVSKYYHGCLNFDYGLPVSSYQLEPDTDLVKRITQIVRNIIKILPSPDTFSFHAEFILDSNTSDIYLCEIASRTGGGGIGETYKLFTDVDLNKNSVINQIEKTGISKSTINSLKFGFILFPPIKKIFNGFKNTINEDWIEKWELKVKEGESCLPASFSADYILKVTISGETSDLLKERIDYLVSYYNNNVIWEDY